MTRRTDEVKAIAEDAEEEKRAERIVKRLCFGLVGLIGAGLAVWITFLLM